MAFAKETYFNGEPDYYVCPRNKDEEKKLIKSYIDYIVHDDRFDEGFKKFVQVPGNVKIKMKYATAVKAYCSSLMLGYTYKNIVSTVTGYTGKYNSYSDSVTITEDKDYSYYDAESFKFFNDYIIESKAWYEGHSYSQEKALSYIRAAKKVADITEYSDRNFKEDDFIESAYCYDPNRSMLEEMVKEERDSIKKIWLKNCYVRDMSVTLIPVYKIVVVYEGEEYTSSSHLLGNNPDTFYFRNAGKFSERHLREQEYKKATKIMRKRAKIAVWVMLAIQILFGIISIVKSNTEEIQALGRIPIINMPLILFYFLTVAVLLFTVIYGFCLARIVEPYNPCKIRRAIYWITSILFVAFMVFVYVAIYTVLPDTFADVIEKIVQYIGLIIGCSVLLLLLGAGVVGYFYQKYK